MVKCWAMFLTYSLAVFFFCFKFTAHWEGKRETMSKACKVFDFFSRFDFEYFCSFNWFSQNFRVRNNQNHCFQFPDSLQSKKWREKIVIVLSLRTITILGCFLCWHFHITFVWLFTWLPWFVRMVTHVKTTTFNHVQLSLHKLLLLLSNTYPYQKTS